MSSAAVSESTSGSERRGKKRALTVDTGADAAGVRRVSPRRRTSPFASTLESAPAGEAGGASSVPADMLTPTLSKLSAATDKMALHTPTASEDASSGDTPRGIKGFFSKVASVFSGRLRKKKVLPGGVDGDVVSSATTSASSAAVAAAAAAAAAAEAAEPGTVASSGEERKEAFGEEGASAAAAAQRAQLVAAFGEDIVAKFESSTWGQRKEAIAVVRSRVESRAEYLREEAAEGDEEGGGVMAEMPFFEAVCVFALAAMGDPVAPVYFSVFELIRSLVDCWGPLLPTASVDAAGAAQARESASMLVPALLTKLGDRNKRTQRESLKALLVLSRQPSLGLPIITQHLATDSLPQLPRLNVLRVLVPEVGLGKGAAKFGITLIMQVAVPALKSADGKVRKAAVAVVVEAYKLGGHRVKKHLERCGLKAATLKTLEKKFERCDGGGDEDLGLVGTSMKRGRSDRGSMRRGRSSRRRPRTVSATPAATAEPVEAVPSLSRVPLGMPEGVAFLPSTAPERRPLPSAPASLGMTEDIYGGSLKGRSLADVSAASSSPSPSPSPAVEEAGDDKGESIFNLAKKSTALEPLAPKRRPRKKKKKARRVELDDEELMDSILGIEDD